MVSIGIIQLCVVQILAQEIQVSRLDPILVLEWKILINLHLNKYLENIISSKPYVNSNPFS